MASKVFATGQGVSNTQVLQAGVPCSFLVQTYKRWGGDAVKVRVRPQLVLGPAEMLVQENGRTQRRFLLVSGITQDAVVTEPPRLGESGQSRTAPSGTTRRLPLLTGKVTLRSDSDSEWFTLR